MLLRGVYQHDYIDHWQKFNETLPEKEDFDGHLNREDITDADYMLAKRICKDGEIKQLGEYHCVYVQNNTLLLADVFEIFGICVLKYINSTLLFFFLRLD